MILGVLILNYKYYYKKYKEQGGKFIHIYLGLGSILEYNIINYLILSSINRLIVFF